MVAHKVGVRMPVGRAVNVEVGVEVEVGMVVQVVESVAVCVTRGDGVDAVEGVACGEGGGEGEAEATIGIGSYRSHCLGMMSRTPWG